MNDDDDNIHILTVNLYQFDVNSSSLHFLQSFYVYVSCKKGEGKKEDKILYSMTAAVSILFGHVSYLQCARRSHSILS